MKREIKEIFILQRNQMLINHEKEKEHDLLWFYNPRKELSSAQNYNETQKDHTK